jgi:acetate---CoA ligase (ADP-forming)
MTSLREALFAPRSIAIIGQSDDPGKTAGRPLRYLRQAGFAGRLFPVNPARDTVLGEPAWPSLAALPEAPDHAYIVTPADAAVEAAAECARLGVKVATLLADGFTEAGEKGAARVARLHEITEKTGMRIVGPSSLGVVDLRTKALITANAAFDERDLPVGRFFAASHSGSMIGALLSRGKARGIAFAGLISVGNEVDLSLGEICELTLDETGIDGYLLFLETMRNAPALRRFALEAAARGKPVLAYKLGRSAAARELAVTHTGSLAGEDDVASAFLADCGIARVDTLEALIEGLPLLACVPAAKDSHQRSVGVVTTTGGGATTAIDPLAARGIAIEPPSAPTLARLQRAGIDVQPSRLVDLTLTGTRYDVMKVALDILTTAPEFDLVLCVVGSSARFYPDLAVRPIIDCAGAGPRKPLAAYLAPEAPDALAALSRAGVPNFRTPEACADAIAAALRRRLPLPLSACGERSPPKAAGEGHPPKALLVDSPPHSDRLRDPTPDQVRGRLSPRKRGEVDDSRHVRLLDEIESYELLANLGIACAPSYVLGSDIRRAPTLPFSYPISVKALAAEIAHKSDVGGVALGISDAEALLSAIREIRRSVAEHRPGTAVDRVLVQPMMAGLGEVLIGYRVDPEAGPLVIVALGGIFTEIYRDRSLRLAPVHRAVAHEMIGEVRGLIPLAGYRGRPKGDLDALADAIVKLSCFADTPNVLEAEINPLIVRADGEGVVAVDALVRIG